jgi:hypothetical protein
VPINFNPSTEILRLCTTIVPGTMQIMANDNSRDLMILLTWDFHKNMEISVKQLVLSPLWTIENYLIMGMHQKLNYYLDPEYLIDMEYCIPHMANTASSKNPD